MLGTSRRSSPCWTSWHGMAQPVLQPGDATVNALPHKPQARIDIYPWRRNVNGPYERSDFQVEVLPQGLLCALRPGFHLGLQGRGVAFHGRLGA